MKGKAIITKNSTYKVNIKDGGFLPEAAAVVMVLSGCVRIIYYSLLYKDNINSLFLAEQIILPLLCVFGFAVLSILRNIRFTFIPFVLGIVFFIIKALGFSPVQRVLCITLYIALGILYTLVVFCIIPYKKLLITAFALPLAAHIGMDIYEFLTYKNIVPANYLPELSVLLIMAALLIYSCSLKFRKIA
jgi:hypothetical protein